MRILLVDDERMLLTSVSRSLHLDRPGWEVLLAGDGAMAMHILESEPVDILVTDLNMPGMGGLALLEQIRKDPVRSRLPLIIMTSNNDRASMRMGMDSGADDFLTKPFTTSELILAIEVRLARLRPEADRAASGGDALPELKAPLTAREREVLARIGSGLVTKEIAEKLGMSPRTVSAHRASIMRKLDLHNAAALAAWAIRARIS